MLLFVIILFCPHSRLQSDGTIRKRTLFWVCIIIPLASWKFYWWGSYNTKCSPKPFRAPPGHGPCIWLGHGTSSEQWDVVEVNFAACESAIFILTYLGDIEALISGHHDKESHHLIAGGGSYVQFEKNKIKNATSVKCNKAKHNKMSYDYNGVIFG